MSHGVGQHFISGATQASNLEGKRTSNALADLALEQRRQSGAFTQQQQGVSGELQKIKFMNNAAKSLIRIPAEQRASAFQRLEPLAERVGIQPGSFTVDQLTDENLNQLINSTSQFIQNPQALTAKLQEQEADFKILEGAVDEQGQLKPIEQLTSEQLAIARKLNILARPVGSAAITTATTPGLTDVVAGSEEILTGAKETGKLTAQLKFKPLIQAAIKTAEAEANANAETFTSLKRAKAALPGLTDVIDQLKTLAPIATNTFAGRAFDSVVKELGFGGTEGATARAKFVSLINNQVLPLLRETFGAAFTAQEGESLKATMGDVNASNEEKLAQLNAFIEQKFRDIETKQRELDSGTTQRQVDVTNLSDDELFN